MLVSFSGEVACKPQQMFFKPDSKFFEAKIFYNSVTGRLAIHFLMLSRARTLSTTFFKLGYLAVKSCLAM